MNLVSSLLHSSIASYYSYSRVHVNVGYLTQDSHWVSVGRGELAYTASTALKNTIEQTIHKKKI